MQNLLGLTEKELALFADTVGEPRYRGKQIYQWLYTKGAASFSEMTDLGKSFRELLQETAHINMPVCVTSQHSKRDGTTKFLFELADGLRIESVLIPPASAFADPEAAEEEEQKRLTVCISTQVGCPLDCKFCATATMGYLRNLTAGEIVGQVLQVKRLSEKKITNVVFMGMGEPMMNYDNVMKSVEILSAGVKIAAKKITISTAGWADQIRRMADDRCRAKLAVSLHSANDTTRSMLMPINRKFNLETLLNALEYFYEKTNVRVTYEYIFFDGVNDSAKDVQQLVKLARRVPSKINVIPFHSIAFAHPSGTARDLKPSPRLGEIVDTLRSHHLTVMVRSNAGEDIDAACGQLAVKTERAKPASRNRVTQPKRLPRTA